MSTKRKRQLALNVFFMRFGHHPEAWRHPGNAGASGRPDVKFWVGLAQLAERAKLDIFFLADFIGRSGKNLRGQGGGGGGSAYQFEPLTLLSAIAVQLIIGAVRTLIRQG